MEYGDSGDGLENVVNGIEEILEGMGSMGIVENGGVWVG